MAMSDDEFDDYDSKVTFMFPGQGAQYMGMAASICDEVTNPQYKAVLLRVMTVEGTFG